MGIILMLKQKLLISLMAVGFVGGGLYTVALNKSAEKPLFEMKIEDVKKPEVKPMAEKKPTSNPVAKKTEVVEPKTAIALETVALKPKAEEQKKPEPVSVSEPEPIIIPQPTTAETPEQVPEAVSEPSTQPQPESIKVLIVEIMFDAVGNDVEKEFIKLFNPTNADIGLEDWSLKSGVNSLVKIGQSPGDKTIISAQGYFMVGLNKNPNADATRSSVLTNGAAQVTLYTDSGEIMDEALYDGAVLEEGVSWRRM